jgi:tetratricopeptide (TPR) repeat protein
VLDNDAVQCALILAAGIVPLMLAIFVPRAVYRVDVPDGRRVAATGGASPAPSPGDAPDDASARPGPVKSKRSPAVVKPAASQPGPDVLYRRGKDRRARGDYLGAICDFDEVLRVKPEFVWCYYERAGAYSRMGNQQAALADLDRALLALPREPKVWHARAVVHYRLPDLKAAVAEIRHAVELVEVDERDDKEAFAQLLRSKAEMLTDELFEHATALVKAGQHAAAAEEFSEVIQHRPSCVSAWLRRGLAYDLKGQYAKALDDLNVALELRPGPAQAFKLRSELHERNEDYGLALADMRAARRLDPARVEYAERMDWLAAQQQQAQQRARQIAVRWRMR